jgi:predicted TIM-barrel fold metal-dependent hydrolase
MPSPIVDSHLHVLPDWAADYTPDFAQPYLSQIRRRAREWLKPFSKALHHTQPWVRHIPEAARIALDELTLAMPLGLIVESTPSDLDDVMNESGIDYALAIASPPLSDNDFILDLADKNPKILPVVNIPRTSARPASLFKKYVKRGARALKIHPAMDGEGVDSTRYKSLIKAAGEAGLPVIIHTGCIHTHAFYRDPSQGRAENFERWYASYPDVRFILAHTNFHEPQVALELADKYPNLFVETSWQPAEIISESVRRIGAERVLFGSDWPLVGNNIAVGIGRVRECAQFGWITEKQSELILGLNSLKLFGINPNAT